MGLTQVDENEWVKIVGRGLEEHERGEGGVRCLLRGREVSTVEIQ